MNDYVKDLLADPLKGTTRVQGVLCYLFRHVLLWRKVNQIAWKKRAEKFFQKEHNKTYHPETGKEIPGDKGNLNKELTRREFTWANFKKGIDFLNPISATLTLKFTWLNGLESSYSINIDPAEDESDVDTIDNVPISDVFDGRPPAKNTLSRLFQRILTDEGIDIPKWEALLDQYVSNPTNGIPQSKAKTNEAINAIQRELLHPRMSWNVFRKGINLLNPQRTDYILKMRWSERTGEETYHIATLYNPMDERYLTPLAERKEENDVGCQYARRRTDRL